MTPPHGRTAKKLRTLCAVAAVSVVICSAVLFPFAMFRSVDVTGTYAHFEWRALLGLFPFGLTVFGSCRYFRVLSKKTFSQWKQILIIRNANPYIQTKLVNHGNTSKRTLFDGWRFVMRNLILVLAITNLISLWKPLDLYRRVAREMVGAGGTMTRNLFLLTLIVSCTICLILVRYYHYAFLRYKYSLENFMRLDKEDGETNGPEQAAKQPQEGVTA